MQSPALRTLLSYLHRLSKTESGTDLNDADLLEQFRSRRDEAAFALLMQRHGATVFGVCRRLLGDSHEAEDTFQATFLVLVRKAGSIRKQQSLSSWLYGVAYRIAVRARSRANQQRLHEQLARSPVPPDGTLDQVTRNELQHLLDREMGQLPDKYRAPLVLCYLEGKTHEQAARELGWPRSSVTARLERACELLRRRLARQGYGVTAGLVAVVLAEQSATAEIPALLTLSTVRLVSQVLTGRVVSATTAVALADGAARGMAMTKIFALTGLLLAVGLAAGVGIVTFPQGDPSENPAQQKEREAPLEPAARTDSPSDALPAGAVAWLSSDPLRVGQVELAMTRDGKQVVALSESGIAHTFDAQTGKRLGRRVLGDRRDSSTALSYGWALSRDGSTATTVDDADRLRVWDVGSGELRSSFRTPNVVSQPYSSPDGNLIVRVLPRRGRTSIEVRDSRTGQTREFGVAEPNLIGVQFTPDGKRILATYWVKPSDKEGHPVLVCFDLAQGKKFWDAKVSSQVFAISTDGRFVFIGTDEAVNPLRVLNTETGQPAEGVRMPPRYEVLDSPVSVPDGRSLLIPLRSGEVAVWDYREGREVRRLRASRVVEDELQSCTVAVSPDGKTAVTNGDGLRGWDLGTGRQRFGPGDESGHARAVQTLAFQGRGKELVSVGLDGALFRWDVATGRRIQGPTLARASDMWSTRSGLRVAKLSWSQLTIYDAFTGNQAGQVKFPDDRTPRSPEMQWQYALLADGRTALTYFPQRDKATIAVTDYTTSRQLSEAEIVPPSRAMFQAFSPCGRWFVAYGAVFDVRTGEKLWTAAAAGSKGSPSDAFARFSPDGRLLCGRVESTEEPPKEGLQQDEYVVWEVASGAVVRRYWLNHVGQVAFSPDNRLLAYVTGWGIQLIDLTTGRHIAAFEDPDVNCTNFVLESTASTLVFAPDSKFLAAGHHDGSIAFWKVPEPAAARLTDGELEAVWDELAGVDGTKARSAIDRLVRNPELAIALLSEKFKPAASREGKGSSPLNGEVLRSVRAIEVLERIGTERAKELLQARAAQSADARLATEAHLVLERLGFR